MLIELPQPALSNVRPLIAGLPGLRGCLDAALEGAMGTVYADDAERPTLVLVDLDFLFVAGDSAAPAAAHAVRGLELPASIITSSGYWEPLLRRVWGESLRTHTRVAFSPGKWDRRDLRAFMDALPDSFALRRITRGDARRFEDLAESLVYNFDSLDAFVRHGVGFGVEHEGRFVSGCSSFAISSRSLEFEIQTHPRFRRRGLATAAAAAMIDYCLDQGLEPCWDAHNEMSAALATKIGFTKPAPYLAYELPASARPKAGGA